jgi:predicted dehydrogenase
MGNQGHSSDDARRINEWIQAGAIGTVREVHVWTNRPIWPQGINRPEEKVKVPKDLDWEIFLGPAPYVEYHPAYHPFSWRGWADYGVGALGDMGAHLIDHPYWALGLDYPITVEASSTPWGGKEGEKASYPLATTVHYVFPSRGMLPEVHMHWYDGGLMPPRPAVLPDEVQLDRTGGVIFVGDKGILMHKTYGSDPQLYPQSLMAEYVYTPIKYKRITTSHEMNWIEAIQGKAEATSPFDYAAPLTETMLLGVVALHAPGQTLRYDSEKMAFTNNTEVNRHLSRDYRDGWIL